MAQLDHDPALGLRETNKNFEPPDPRHWIPNANDKDCLRWREKTGDHHIKTYVRGERGARSDFSEMKHRRIVAKNKLPRSQAQEVPHSTPPELAIAADPQQEPQMADPQSITPETRAGRGEYQMADTPAGGAGWKPSCRAR
jgi:hypothetical protein